MNYSANSAAAREEALSSSSMGRAPFEGRACEECLDQPASADLEAFEGLPKTTVCQSPGAEALSTNTFPSDLTLKTFLQDGSCAEFFQDDLASAAKILHSLTAPRLFAQTALMLSSKQGVSLVRLAAVDLIEAHTWVPVRLAMPARILDVCQISTLEFDLDSIQAAAGEVPQWDPSFSRKTVTSHVEIGTVGGWKVTLRITAAVVQETVQDKRLQLMHLFDLPVFPFYLETGGIGLLNPVKVSRVSAFPEFDGLPETALRAGLLRWTREGHQRT